MFDGGTLAAYVTACIALLVVPGPSVLYIITRSIEGGRAAGLVSALGIATGTVGHVCAAAIGLSALLAGSPVAYTVVRFAGAGYLVYLGIARLAAEESSEGSSDEPPVKTEPHNRRLGRIYRQAILVNLLNPKTALFFLAFLPQFVDRDGGPVAAQIVVLGLILIGLGAMSDGTYAILAGTAGRALTRTRIFPAVKRFGAGTVYLGLGVIAAVYGG